jgi:ATP-dependent helicase Lhr and Lhr-like helicase
VLPARVTDYAPAMLDELTSSGEVAWAGTGALPGNDGWVTLSLADTADLLLPEPDDALALTPLHAALLDALDGDVALFFRALADRVATRDGPGTADGSGTGAADDTRRGTANAHGLGAVDDQALVAALWDLVWAGRVTNDTLAPLRTLLGAGRTAHRGRTAPTRARRGRGTAGRAPPPGRTGRPAMPSRTGPPTAAGRWSLLPERDPDPTHRAHARAEAMLDRHGVLTRGAVGAEQVPGGFAATYRVLSAFEDAGRVRRGYYVEGLGAAQFATPGAVDRLRATAQRDRADADRPAGDGAGAGRDRDEPSTLVLAATDPANPYGAALPWPSRPGEAGGHRPGRKAGALVVLVRGHLVLYVERGGRTLLSLTDADTLLGPAVQALASAVTDGALGRLTVERTDGARALDTPLGRALEHAGFRATPRGLRLRP